jgi:hypothetical protein
MINYSLIILPEHNIIVSDEKTVSGELSWSPTQNHIGINGNSWEDTNQKIIAGIEDLPKINYNGFFEKLGIVDVGKYWNLYRENRLESMGNSHLWDEFEAITNFIAGFNAAQSLNNKKFSDVDIMNAIDMAREGIRVTRISEWETEKEFEYNDTQIIQSLSQPKVIPIELEMEAILEHTKNCLYSDEKEYLGTRLKITNNSVKIKKLL